VRGTTETTVINSKNEQTVNCERDRRDSSDKQQKEQRVNCERNRRNSSDNSNTNRQ
jgi:hypothetical protein